jgi:hypothetical protein
VKVYTLGRYGLVSLAVLEAIGHPSHRQQADVYIIARTKTAAVEFAHECGIHVSPNSEDFRQAMGDRLDALREAGLCGEPGLLVTSNLGGDLPVARIAVGGAPEVIGTLVSNYPNARGYTFRPNT